MDEGRLPWTKVRNDKQKVFAAVGPNPRKLFDIVVPELPHRKVIRRITETTQEMLPPAIAVDGEKLPYRMVVDSHVVQAALRTESPCGSNGG